MHRNVEQIARSICAVYSWTTQLCRIHLCGLLLDNTALQDPSVRFTPGQHSSTGSICAVYSWTTQLYRIHLSGLHLDNTALQDPSERFTPGQHSSERHNSCANTVSELTGPGIEPKSFSSNSNAFQGYTSKFPQPASSAKQGKAKKEVEAVYNERQTMIAPNTHEPKQRSH